MVAGCHPLSGGPCLFQVAAPVLCLPHPPAALFVLRCLAVATLGPIAAPDVVLAGPEPLFTVLSGRSVSEAHRPRMGAAGLCPGVPLCLCLLNTGHTTTR